MTAHDLQTGENATSISKPMIVQVARDYDHLSRVAARILARRVLRKPNVRLGLAAGRSPLGTYHELVRIHLAEKLDVSRVVFFSLDEYGLRKDDLRRFEVFLNGNLLRLVHANAANIRLLRYPKGRPVEAFCSDYERSIRDAGGIDLQILGIGRNGHIGFNEPGSSFESRTRTVTLAHGAPSKTAVTMGVATILEAREILLLVSGEEKSAALSAAIAGPVTEAVPASVLQRHPNVTVVADRDSLRRLRK